MAERGNKKNRIVDKYVGIPLTVPAALFRRLDRPRRDGRMETAAIICLGAIGDLLLTSGLINALNSKGLAVDLYTSMANANAAALLCGVRKSASYPLSKIPLMIRELRNNRYDLLIDTTQWARVGAIVSAFSKAGTTVGFCTKGEYRSLPYDLTADRLTLRHESENFMALARTAFPDAKGELDLNIPELTGKIQQTLPERKYVVCHMWAQGSYSAERQWPSEKWAALAEKFDNLGFDTVFTGSSADTASTGAFFAEYLTGKNYAHNFSGKINLLELAAVLKESVAVVSVNTGVMHMAALTGAPTAGLHGPTNPVHWGPVGKNAAAVCHKGIERYADLGSAKVVDPATYTCHVDVDEVLDAIRSLMN